MITVALVDDHAILRDPLAKVINEFEGYKVTCLAGNGKALVEHIVAFGPPNIVILDLNMPVMDGYETALYLQKNHPEVLAMTLSAYDSEMILVRLLRMGVKGFMRKDISPVELNNALNEVQQKGFYYWGDSSNRLVNLIRDGSNEWSDVNKSLLTEKEIELIKLCCSDMTYKAIAQAMQISPRAVDAMRESLFTKLNLGSRVTLVMYAMRQGLVPL